MTTTKPGLTVDQPGATSKNYDLGRSKINVEKEFLLPRDYACDLTFFGKMIATIVNDDGRGRRTRFSLYKTIDEKWVCGKYLYTRWVGEYHTFNAMLCSSIEEIINFFGIGQLAKALYVAANLDISHLVEEMTLPGAPHGD